MPNFPGQGPLDLVPDSKMRRFLATVAFTKGQIATITTAAGTASYSVVLADDDTALRHVCGVAKGAIAAGEWGEFYVAGYCPAVLSGGSVAAGDFLVASTTAGTAVSATIADNSGYIFGVALMADTGSPVFCDAILDCRGSAA
jgi:ribulose kinase